MKQSSKKHQKTSSKNFWKALTIFVICIILSFGISFHVKRDVESQEKKEFSLVCNEIKSIISARLHAHAQLLRCGSTFFSASDSVTRLQWKIFNERAKISKNLPGIQGIGYSKIIKKNQLQHHIQSIKKEGYPNYSIKPAGERDIYTSIIYLEPFTNRNLRAFGYDMYSEPVRRKAMEAACDSDLAVLSGKVILIQETKKDVQAGTLMYVPVYRNGKPINTVDERRAAIIGWVYSPYRMNDLMNGILGRWDLNQQNRIHLQIYDNENISDESLLYDSQLNDSTNNNALVRKILLPVEFNGKKWSLFFTQSETHYYSLNNKVTIVSLGGLIVSLLIFSLSLSLFNTKHRAEYIAGKLTAKLKESEENFSSLFNQSPIAIEYYNSEGILMNANPACLELFGITDINEIKQFSLFADPNISEEHKTALKAHKNISYQASFDFDKVKELNLYKTTKNGLIWLDIIIASITDRHKKPNGYLIQIQDITIRKESENLLMQKTQEIEAQSEEYKQINEELIVSKEKAEESDRLKSAFLANMSHEIRTPMNGILGFAELLKQENLSNENQEKYIEIIEKSGHRMLSVINDIISISRVESGLMSVYYSDTSINELFEFIYNFFKPEVDKKDIKFLKNNTLIEKNIFLKTDREKIYAILTNLIKNAVKFTNTGSIEFGCIEKDGFIEFNVKDTGIGVCSRHKEFIFERFRQGNDSLTREHQGAGLGLSISKAYVEMLGGNIWMESEEGKGSTFYFSLPLNTDSAKQDKTDNTKKIIEINNKIKPLKILITEDDEVSAKLITLIISKFCKEVLRATTGIEAIEICRSHKDIDLVLMDINMPEMNGLEATRQIRETGYPLYSSNIISILLSL
ncbi:MAG: CHASE domain-containing protein, partial [Bacteroidota bacterium]